MLLGLKKFALPLIIVVAGSTAGVGFGLTNYYGKNTNPFAEYIEKIIEDDNTNNYSLFCQEWIVNKRGDRKDDMSQEKCKKLIESMWGKGKQNQPEKWLRVSQSKFNPVFEEYFRTFFKKNNLSAREKIKSSWEFEKLNCTTKQEYGKITISCFKNSLPKK